MINDCTESNPFLVDNLIKYKGTVIDSTGGGGALC